MTKVWVSGGGRQYKGKKKRLRDKRRKGASSEEPLYSIDLKRSETSQRKSGTNTSSLV